MNQGGEVVHKEQRAMPGGVAGVCVLVHVSLHAIIHRNMAPTAFACLSAQCLVCARQLLYLPSQPQALRQAGKPLPRR